MTMHNLVTYVYRGTALFYFFFNDTATPEIYTLSLHDALPIFSSALAGKLRFRRLWAAREVLCRRSRIARRARARVHRDRKSTRLNSSHPSISYAVFCLKKKNTN